MGGKIGSTDTWSCGFAFQVSGGVPSNADMNGIASGFSTLFATDFWDHANGLKTYVNLTTDWSKCNTYYYPAGSTVATVSGTVTLTADPGTNGTQQIPPQCAMVATLKTGLTGRQNTGRVYLPSPASLSTNGQILGTYTDYLATQLAQWLTDCNSATVGPLSFNACVGTGNTPHITTVVIDTVVDTQRRRRDKQIAAHKSSHAV